MTRRIIAVYCHVIAWPGMTITIAGGFLARSVSRHASILGSGFSAPNEPSMQHERAPGRVPKEL